ncbi:MAG TPA: hypothetical protein PKI62_10010 [bacterium]|nr:hypothetical protein [bacterium]HPR88005.1 hypothetical protein [bacterium]
MHGVIHRLAAAVILVIVISAAAPAQELADTTLASLLPQPGDLPAWRQTEAPRFFHPENLFEYIDGAADLYLQYGFRRVLTTDYAVGPDSSSVTVEIYAMKSPLHAFAIFAAERSPEETPAGVGVEGYRSANVLNFYQGPCYVKITSFALEKDPGAALTEMGRILAGRIGGGTTPPELFSRFPETDRVPASDRYVPGDFLGQSFFREGYRREYRSACGSWQLFLVPCQSAAEAQELFARYSQFLLQRNVSSRQETIGGHPALFVQRPAGIDLVFFTDSFVCGALGPPCEETLRAQLEEMARRLDGR